jgi:hypothetical protein
MDVKRIIECIKRMKNKIFELYKPNSLMEFLDFYKNNSEEKNLIS